MSDAIVIGAGPNGLAAAIRLAEAGRSVLVLEAADAPGGAVRTEELTLPGFKHDTFSSVYPAAVASPVWGRMPLEDHGLEWVHPEAAYAHPLPGGEAIALYRDVARTAASLGPDGAAWADYVGPFLDRWNAVRETMLSGFPPLGGPLKLGPKLLAEFPRLLAGSATGLGKRLFDSPDARAWLYGAALHGDAPPDAAGSGIAAFYLNLLGHAVGWPSPRGGAERLTDALVSYLHEPRRRGPDRRPGGEGARDRPRDRRDVGRRALRGVDRGRRRDARRADADDRVPGLVPDGAEGLRARRPDREARLGARRPDPVGERGRPRRRHRPRRRQRGRVPARRQAGPRRPGRAAVPAARPADASPTPRARPEGKHTAWAYTHGPQDAPWTDGIVERMEAQVERFAPGFRDRILARHVLDPAALEARNANLIGGDVGGGSYKLRQVVFRPLPKLSPYSTPLKGLFIGSAATFPGGAVHGVCGDAAARAALR